MRFCLLTKVRRGTTGRRTRTVKGEAKKVAETINFLYVPFSPRLRRESGTSRDESRDAVPTAVKDRRPPRETNQRRTKDERVPGSDDVLVTRVTVLGRPRYVGRRVVPSRLWWVVDWGVEPGPRGPRPVGVVSPPFEGRRLLVLPTLPVGTAP